MMTRVKRAYTDGRFGQLHYRIAAPEIPSALPPLYCLHQSPKCGLEFETLMRTVGRERIVVAPDYPGYGGSDAPPAEHDATTPAYAEACWQVAGALGHDTLDLFGNHTGAKVAAEMATSRPDRVRSIAMVSAALLTPEERAFFSDYFTPIPLDEAGTRFTTMWERILKRRGPGTSLEMLAQSYMMNLLGGEAYEWGHIAAFAWDQPFVDALKTLPHRITILNPDDDLAECTRRAPALLKNGEVIECPQWGYNFMDVWPEDVAALLAKVLR
ncbi:alpha/beta fold hydrolase [Hyphomonas sp.]|uniref:alpha/beta fold hydrolase n=1 Tax=Hyphomonas sp. TaxID=87 RepID=UPI003918BF97